MSESESQTFELSQIFSMIAVSCLWGITNPFISRGAKTSKSVQSNFSPFLKPFFELKNFIQNWRFSIPFIFNQLASILFMVLVVTLPLSMTVICVNSLTFVVTALTGAALGEAPLSKNTILGTFLVLIGVILITV
uniref:Transmembrane protein 234 n=1 Tax=Panagrolaimus superbus TaxID=310955 RepID=A0A914YUN7_9BILA